MVTKNLQVASVMMERFCKNKQNDHHKGLDFTHQIIHRFKIFESILVEVTWNTVSTTLTIEALSSGEISLSFSQ